MDVPWLVVPGLALQLVTRPAPSNASWCIDGQTFHIPESDMEIYKWKPVVVVVQGVRMLGEGVVECGSCEHCEALGPGIKAAVLGGINLASVPTGDGGECQAENLSTRCRGTVGGEREW